MSQCGAAAIVVEDLDFTTSKSKEKHGHNKRFRHVISHFPTARLRARLVSMAAERSVAIVAGDPAYTSRWGGQHRLCQYTVTEVLSSPQDQAKHPATPRWTDADAETGGRDGGGGDDGGTGAQAGLTRSRGQRTMKIRHHFQAMSAARELGHPLALPRRFNGSTVIVRSRPRDCVRGGQPGQDGQAGDDGTGATNSFTAGDLDHSTGLCLVVQYADVPDGVISIAGQQEVGPLDPHARPGQLTFMTSAKTVRAQVEAEVGPGFGRRRAAQATTADPGAVGQPDGADER